MIPATSKYPVLNYCAVICETWTSVIIVDKALLSKVSENTVIKPPKSRIPTIAFLCFILFPFKTKKLDKLSDYFDNNRHLIQLVFEDTNPPMTLFNFH